MSHALRGCRRPCFMAIFTPATPPSVTTPARSCSTGTNAPPGRREVACRACSTARPCRQSSCRAGPPAASRCRHHRASCWRPTSTRWSPAAMPVARNCWRVWPLPSVPDRCGSSSPTGSSRTPAPGATRRRRSRACSTTCWTCAIGCVRPTTRRPWRSRPTIPPRESGPVPSASCRIRWRGARIGPTCWRISPCCRGEAASWSAPRRRAWKRFGWAGACAVAGRTGAHLPGEPRPGGVPAALEAALELQPDDQEARRLEKRLQAFEHATSRAAKADGWAQVRITSEERRQGHLHADTMALVLQLFHRHGVVQIDEMFEPGFVESLHQTFLDRYRAQLDLRRQENHLQVGDKRFMLRSRWTTCSARPVSSPRTCCCR